MTSFLACTEDEVRPVRMEANESDANFRLTDVVTTSLVYFENKICLLVA